MWQETFPFFMMTHVTNDWLITAIYTVGSSDKWVKSTKENPPYLWSVQCNPSAQHNPATYIYYTCIYIPGEWI